MHIIASHVLMKSQKLFKMYQVHTKIMKVLNLYGSFSASPISLIVELKERRQREPASDLL